MSKTRQAKTAISLSEGANLQIGGGLKVKGYDRALDMRSGSRASIADGVDLEGAQTTANNAKSDEKSTKSHLSAIGENTLANILGAKIGPWLPPWGQ